MKAIALVTGVNRGIGNEVCLQLAQHNYLALLTGRNLAKAKEAATDIDMETVQPAQLDVTDESSIAPLARQSAHPRIVNGSSGAAGGCRARRRLRAR